jgi:uncharacterized damage-inducible protein DinB
MATRSEQLAEQFEDANDEFIGLIERLDERQWQAGCAGEGWSVGVAANHLAWASAALADVIKNVGSGTAAGLTMEMLKQMNAQESAQSASLTKQEVLAKLRGNGAMASETIRGLSDDDLEKFDILPEGHPVRVLDGMPEKATARLWIESVLIPHYREHGSSILAAAYPGLIATKTPAMAHS